jgi:quinol monooxygenase YgiN
VGEAFGMHVEFTAVEGRGDELEALLLAAAAGLEGEGRCRMYVVSRSPDRPETVWVTELWDSREAHQASLRSPATRELIGRAMELMAASPSATALRPVGGKGVGMA